MKAGCSDSFYSAIDGYNFRKDWSGENLVLVKQGYERRQITEGGLKRYAISANLRSSESYEQKRNAIALTSVSEVGDDFRILLMTRGFFDDLPDDVMTSFTDNAIFNEFLRYLSSEKPEMKEALLKSIRNSMLIENIDNNLKTKFNETIIDFMKRPKGR